MVTCKIAFQSKPKDLVVKEVTLPPIKPDQVLIKLKAAGICGSDVECYEGKSGEGRYDIAPYTPGHEWAGEVIEAGEDVTIVKPGDKVTGDCVLNCFYCANCKSGLMPSACLNMREAGFRPDSPGGWGEYLILEHYFIHKLPNDWTYEEGALVEPFSIGYFGLWGNNGYVDASDNVVVFGAGSIGLCALMAAKASRAKVIQVEPLPKRQEFAKRIGADYIIDPSKEDVEAKVAEYTDGVGGNIVIEASGNDKAIASMFDVAAHSARVRLIGHSIGRKVPIEIGKTIWKTLLITGSGGVRNFMPRTITFMDRIRSEFNFADLISDRYSFDELDVAMKKAVEDKANAFKVMLTFD
ncbi:MAG: alcohol dehydrogenase catalytic domain-containing protein [Actinomycetia bacterium]|nr:alcohol dehydrogenase catalytic domain-containing protein [Actinomycetes bacterium]